jgi:PAS domain S-box-containing protein
MSTRTKSQLEIELKEAQAQITRLEAALRDVVSGREAEADISTDGIYGQEKLRKLLEILPVGISILDGERKVVFQNSTLSQILDMTPDGLRMGVYKDRKYLSADGSFMPADGFASVQAAQNGQAVYNVETGVIKETGETIWTSVSAVPMDFPDWKTVIVTVNDTQRKLALDQLQSQRRDLQALIENSDGSIWAIDRQYRLIVGNELYHQNTSAVLGRRFMEGEYILDLEFPQAALDEWRGYYDRALLGERFSVEVQTRFAKPVSFVDYRFNPIISETGEIVGVTVFGRDITERKLAEEKVRQSEKRYRLISENAADVIWVMDPIAGKFTYVSPSVEKLRGYTPEEVMSQPMNEALTPESLRLVSESLQKNLPPFIARGSGTESFINEVDQPCKDGSIVHTEVTTTYLFNEHGNVEIVGVSRDITGRKQDEERRQKSELLFRTLFELSPDAVILIDPHDPNISSAIVDCNTSACLMNGYLRDELIGQSIEILNAAPYSEAGRSAYLEKLRKKGSLKFEVLHRRKDGATFPVETSTTIIQVGERELLIGIDRDITERKQLENDLRESEQRYTLLFQKSAIPVVLIKLPEVVIADANEAAEKLTGFTREEMIGRNSAELGLIDTRQRTETIDQFNKERALNGGEMCIVTKAGDERIIIVNTNPLEIGGQPFAITSMQDITERKQAELIRVRLAERLDLATRSAHMGIWDWDIQKNELAWDDQMYALYGLKPGEFGGAYEAWLNGVHPEDRESSNDVSAASVRGEREYNTEFRVLWPDRSVHWLKANGKVFLDQNGIPLRMVGVNYDITERKQMEDSLREKERRLREAQRIAHIGNWEWNLQTGETRWSAENYAIHGIKQDSPTLTSDTLVKFVHPDDVQMVNEIISQAISNGTAIDLEYRVFRPDGSLRVIHAMGEVTEFDANRKPILMIGTNQDVTDRKQAEDALWRSEQRFRVAIRPTFMILAQTDLNARYIWIHNPHPDFDPGEVLGKTDIELADNDGARTLYQSKLSVISTGMGLQIEISFPLSDGSRVYDVVIEPLHTLDGKILGVTTSSYDITDRKRAEAELRKSEERLRLSLQAANQGLYDLNVQTGDAIVNDEYALMLGYDPSDFHETNSFWIERLHPDDRERTAQAYKDYVDGKLPDYRVEFRQRTRSGTWKWILSLGKLVQWDERGQPLRMLGTHTDINTRKLMENELRRSNAELEQFAYIASHDLQEPLRAVAGMVQLLQKRYQGQLDARADEYIGHAVEAAARMQALIQALLSYSRVERRNQPIELVDAGKCIQSALQNMDVSIHESHAVVTADALPTIHADPVQLIQLFQNLVGNAIKFRGEKEPQIHISATRLKDAWQFSVSDNGIGIESQYFERIFLIFQRLHTRREYTGTGIGLALCKKIVERHGGNIWVESEPGKGSTFHFTLPTRSQS